MMGTQFEPDPRYSGEVNDFEVYLRHRLGELCDMGDGMNGDHAEYGVVFGIIDIDDLDVLDALEEQGLDIGGPGHFFATWNDQGVVDYYELKSAHDYFEAMQDVEAMKQDYQDFQDSMEMQ